MSDKDLIEFNNDFITAVSRYLINVDRENSVKVLKSLAEQGNREALACYYLIKGNDFKNIKLNKFLHEAVEEALTTDYMSKIIVASSLDEDREFYPMSLRKYLNSMSEIYLRGAYIFSESEFLTGEEIVQKNKYGRMLYKASNNLFDKYNLTQNILYLESFLEMRKALMIHVPAKLKINTRLQLAKMYKNNPDDPQIAFALGRNLLMLSDSKLIKNQGNKILTKLAQREYSADINLDNKESVSETN